MDSVFILSKWIFLFYVAMISHQREQTFSRESDLGIVPKQIMHNRNKAGL